MARVMQHVLHSHLDVNDLNDAHFIRCFVQLELKLFEVRNTYDTNRLWYDYARSTITSLWITLRISMPNYCTLKYYKLKT